MAEGDVLSSESKTAEEVADEGPEREDRESGSVTPSLAESSRGEEEEEAAAAAAAKEASEPSKEGSEESFLKWEAESPRDLKRIKWQEVDLLFLKTEYETPFWFEQPMPVRQFDEGTMHLDFAFVKGDVNREEYEYFTEKFGLFVSAYNSKMKSVKELQDQNLAYRTKIEDQRKFERWFESMPETKDSTKTEAAAVSNDKDQVYDIRKERLNAIAYRLVLSDMAEKEVKWTKELQRVADDRDFLAEEVRKYSPDEASTFGPRAVIANLTQDKYDLEEEIAEVQAKAKAIEDFMHGLKARNENLEDKLESLEGKHGEDSKELTDLRFDIDRQVKMRNELKIKSLDQEKHLEDLEAHKQAFSKQFQKLQYESSKESQSSRMLNKQMDALTTEKEMWAVRATRIKERLARDTIKRQELNASIEDAKHEFKATEKKIRRGRNMLAKLGNALRQLEKAIASLNAENEAEKNKIATLKECSKQKLDPNAGANERRKIEKEIEKLRNEFIETSRMQGLERQEYIRLYGEVKRMQQNQWTLRKLYQDNIGKIRKARLEQVHQVDNIQKLVVEIEKQKNSIKWVTQQKEADEKLLAKKNCEMRKVLADFKLERLEKSKDLQEHNLRLQAINEWKEINRVGASEEEELKSLKMQLLAKREDVQKRVEAVQEVIDTSSSDLKENKAELNKARIEFEARQIAIQKLKSDLHKRQLESERVIHKYTEMAAERNYKSMKLNDILREQVCYTEHISTAEDMIRRADWELVTRMDVIARLAAIKKMEMLGMDKIREKLSTWQGMLDSLEDLTTRFEDVTNRQLELQKKFEGSRLRLVREKQKEDPDEVRRKLASLEDRVQLKEEKLMELKLMNFHASRLLEGLQKDRDERFEQAQASYLSLVDAKRKSVDADKKTKQVAVEMSLKKTSVESLRKECEAARAQYEEALERFRRGEPPTPEMEAEWLRSVKTKDAQRTPGPEGRSLGLSHAVTLIHC